MGISLDAGDDDFDDMPISNPLPPPPRPSNNRDRKDKDSNGDAARLENLSNEDFRRMVMETPRRVEEQQNHHQKDRYRSRKKGADEEEEGENHGQKKYRQKPKEEEILEQPDLPKYRDRAKERREDQNPDYDHTATELGSLHAVAPPGTVDLRTTDAHRISIENSKFLGGDVEHTHLVKGLDYALLHKVRSEIDRKPDGSENGEDAKRRLQKEDQIMSFRTSVAKLIYQWTVKPQMFNKPNEMFLPGRTAFVFDMEEFSHDIPTTVHRSKADCPAPQETVTVGVDASVLERIAKIMSYLRLGSSGKMLKKKRREKIDGKVKNLSTLPREDGGLSADHEKITEVGAVNGSSKQQQEPTSQKGQKEQLALPAAPGPRKSVDDIFEDAGTDYMPTVPNNGQSPVSEDMEESPRELEKSSYFAEPDYGPAPPPSMDQDWSEQGGYDALQGPVLPSSYQGEWQGYPPPPAESYSGQWLPDQYAYPDQYVHSQIPGYNLQASVIPAKDPRLMTQEEKDRGLGSVFKRDDERLQQRRERDAREKDPNFISESYSECYPGYQEYNREIVDSDDDEDLTKMDMGGRAKGRLHRWDFETEEEWAKYNEQKEAMPKAAFQFGVKMQDGRKTRKQNKDQKLNNELHKINRILERKKKEKMEKVGTYDDSSHYDIDKVPVKRLRVLN